LDGNTLTASWKTGEQVSVRNVTKSTDLTGYLEAESNGVQTMFTSPSAKTFEDGKYYAITVSMSKRVLGFY